MSRQSKLRHKAQARKVAKGSGVKGPKGASGRPSRQPAPPWVRNGTRKPKKVRELEAKFKAERETAEREAKKQATREAVHED